MSEQKQKAMSYKQLYLLRSLKKCLPKDIFRESRRRSSSVNKSTLEIKDEQ